MTSYMRHYLRFGLLPLRTTPPRTNLTVLPVRSAVLTAGYATCLHGATVLPTTCNALPYYRLVVGFT